MTIVRTIDQICEWLEENVCKEVELKKPPRDLNATNVKYEYELVHPHAFPLYVPPKDKLPPGVQSIYPSIAVQLEYGTDETSNREMNISLGFSAWNPGIHPDDWLVPEETEEERPDTFTNSVEGWRDLWNFVDKTVTMIEQTTYMGDDVEVIQGGMEFGPYKEQDSIVSYYPQWFAYFKFKVRSTLLRNNQNYQNLL